MSYLADLSLERVFSRLVVTLPEMVLEKPQMLRLDSMVPSLASVILSAVESLTSMVKFTVASSMVKAGMGTRASSGASTSTVTGLVAPLAASTTVRLSLNFIVRASTASSFVRSGIVLKARRKSWSR